MYQYPMRSLMFVPGHNLTLLGNAVKSEADILLIDLEDSVQPKSNKQIARHNILQFINQGKFCKHPIFPRVNDRESGELLKDITSLTIEGITGFVYPKSKTGEDIYFFDKLLETIEYEKGFSIGHFKIIALIETTSAVLHAEEICAASDRVVAIAFGNEDYLSDLEGTSDESASTIFTARSMVAMAARSQNVVPIDTVHIKVHDLEDLEKNIRVAKGLGFEGMLVLNPKELSLVHKYYSPTLEEVGEAENMVAAFEEAKLNGIGVTMVNGKFIGPPLVRKAMKILEKHKIITNKEDRNS